MALFQGKFRIESARLKGYDYRTPGYYFVTICTKDRRHYFGEIRQGAMQLSAIGQIADQNWRAISNHFPHVIVDEFVIMPNHVHGILRVRHADEIPGKTETVETRLIASLRKKSNHGGVTHYDNPMTKPETISGIIRWYKARCTHLIRKTIDTDFSWQPRFHDHVIRDDHALYQIRQYIRQNPAAWQTDDYFNA